MKKVSNQAIAEMLAGIGEYLDMQKIPFKPRAYEKAAESVLRSEKEVGEIYREEGMQGLTNIPGVGVSIAEKIGELLTTGVCRYYEKLRRKTPIDLSSFTGLEGLGPQSIKKLYQELGVRTIVDLAKAARAGKIRKLKGFGQKTEENILRSIEFLKKSSGKFLLGSVMPSVRLVADRLRKQPRVEEVIVAGSVRRMKETVGDVDILIISENPRTAMDYFVRMPEVGRVHAHGATKSSIQLKSGLDVDVRAVPRESYGSALNYFTGSKEHNVALREIAVKRGWKLNEYGLFKRKRQIAGKTEAGLYEALGLRYVEPELREGTGELEAAKTGNLPSLIEYGDVKGDLQVQTDWTDGAESIESMARAAARRGLSYIAITDHTKRLAMTGGLDEVRILKQMAEIDRINKKLKGLIQILKGTECDILKDGALDLPDRVLSKLDVVGASVHSYFNLDRASQTARIRRAMENPHVDILFHPTGRRIMRRPAYDVSMGELVKTAKKTGTVLEINAFPDRLDLRDEHIRMAITSGVKLSIDSDAHSSAHFAFLEYGIAQARRGWAVKHDIINAWPEETMKKFLKGATKKT